MASKHSLLSATLLLLVLLHGAAAAGFRTNVATAFDYSISEECRRQAESRDLSPCVQFLVDEAASSHPRDVSLSGRGSRAFYKCCDELESIPDYSCRCDGLRAVLEKARGPREVRTLSGTAENVPRMCGISPDTCRFSETWY